MGKGDTKTAKGKRFAGSFGNSRPKLKNKKKTVKKTK
ncbi:MAG TPA: 30S ribosomal protein THX [Oligoflexia bacterium]|nr:30S ribosomal protein THX [Oligoflexia bacterium]HMP47764.1 30S ribosomal protein THX [Oligoflexia bacterium]